MSYNNIAANHETSFAEAGPSVRYDTVFFDMGSTLAKLSGGWSGPYHQVFQKAGLDLPMGEVEAAVGDSWAQVAAEDATTHYEASREATLRWQREVEERVFERLKIHPPQRDELFWQLVEAFEHPGTYELYPDALPTLQALQAAGYRMAIISNWSWHLPDLCESLGLTPYFEQIFTSARLGYAKPHPKIFEAALSAMGCRPDRALHVGDSLSADVGGAGALGLSTLWLVRPDEHPLYDEYQFNSTIRPTRQIKSLDEVGPFLNLK